MNKGLYSSNTAEWATPQGLYDELNSEFHFTLDPCSSEENAKCIKHFTKSDNGLAQDWTGETVFCNPPYGREIREWVRKCYEHFIGGGYSSHANSRQNRRRMVSSVHIWEGRNQVYKGQNQVQWE